MYNTKNKTQFAAITAILLIGCFSVFTPKVSAKMDQEPRFKVYNATNAHQDLDVLAFNKSNVQGGQVAVGDLDGDGLDEIVVGSGAGRPSEVKVFSGRGKDLGWTIAPFGQSFVGGIDVAIADMDGDGKGEIVTAQYAQGNGLIQIYKYNTAKTLVRIIRPFPVWYKGGINIAAGDVTGDTKAEIIVGTSVQNAGRIRMLDAYGNVLSPDFYPLGNDIKGGLDVAVGDIIPGGKKEIAIVPNTNGNARVKMYSVAVSAQSIVKSTQEQTITKRFRIIDAKIGQKVARSNDVGIIAPVLLVAHAQMPETQDDKQIQDNAKESTVFTKIGEFVAFDSNYQGGANIAIDNTRIVVAKNSYKNQSVAIYSRTGQKLPFDVAPYEGVFEGGIQVASGDLDGGSAREIVVMPNRHQRVQTRPEWQTYVEVNLAEQRHYVYENGMLANTGLISSGKTGPTYPGNFTISERTYNKRYVGPGYNLPNTLYNMRYDGPRFLHGAYWHNNFGHPMSHGCVNMPYVDAGWLWDHSFIGMNVWVHR